MKHTMKKAGVAACILSVVALCSFTNPSKTFTATTNAGSKSNHAVFAATNEVNPHMLIFTLVNPPLTDHLITREIVCVSVCGNPELPGVQDIAGRQSTVKMNKL